MKRPALIFRLDGVRQSHRELKRIVFRWRQRRRRVIQVAIQRSQGEAQVLVRRKRERVGFISGIGVGVVERWDECETLRIDQVLVMKHIG